MSMIIIEDCINCGACAVECPSEAIFEPGSSYEINGKFYNPVSNEHFFIVSEICDGCTGLKNIKCTAICPMDAIKKNY